jgi:hypothetical protein
VIVCRPRDRPRAGIQRRQAAERTSTTILPTQTFTDNTNNIAISPPTIKRKRKRKRPSEDDTSRLNSPHPSPEPTPTHKKQDASRPGNPPRNPPRRHRLLLRPRNAADRHLQPARNLQTVSLSPHLKNQRALSHLPGPGESRPDS